MKTVRIVLAASLVLSLRSNIFASSGQAESIKLERKNSFDPLRDGDGYIKGLITGYFGYTREDLAAYTLENCGKEYQGKQIRPGSNPESLELWNLQIQTPQYAKKFIAATNNVAEHISELSYYKKAQDLIEADRQAQVKQSHDNFVAINQKSKAALKDYSNQTIVARKAREKEIHEKYKTLEKAELANLNNHYIDEDQQLAHTLENNKIKLIDIQQTHNNIHTNPEDQITKMPFIPANTTITPKNLRKFAAQYQHWKPKAPHSSAEAIKGEK